jgi:cytochrome c553
MRQTFSVTFKTLVIALGLSLANPAFAADPAKVAPAGPEKADVAKGEALYNAGDAKRGLAACMGCHGPNGVSGGGTYPKLAGQHAAYTVKQLKDYKAGKERPNAIMAAFAGMMTEQDMINVAAYLKNKHLVWVRLKIRPALN